MVDFPAIRAPGTNTSTATSALRETLRQRRRQLGPGAQIAAARCLVTELRKQADYRFSQNIACYLATDGELDCRLLIRQLWKDGKCCFLPVLAENEHQPRLVFSQYNPGSPLIKNRYGIFEPASSAPCSPRVLDLALVPVVGFDQEGNRLGMGGGYYDRTFGFRRQQPLPKLIGVGHRCQRVDRLEPQYWDVPMDTVLAV